MTYQVYNTRSKCEEFYGNERECLHYITNATNYDYLELRKRPIL